MAAHYIIDFDATAAVRQVAAVYQCHCTRSNLLTETSSIDGLPVVNRIGLQTMTNRFMQKYTWPAGS